MDIVFNCPSCRQELEVEESGSGSEIDCPNCGDTITIPEPSPKNIRAMPATSATGMLEGAAPSGGGVLNTPGAEEARSKHIRVPVGKRSAARIEPPKPTLEMQAKMLDRKYRVKTIRNGDFEAHGPGAFDAAVAEFLNRIEEGSLVSVHPVQYTHHEGKTSTLLQDYGVVIVYRG